MCHEKKIIMTVIQLISVDMMHYLISLKRPTNNVFHDYSMLIPVASPGHYLPVTASDTAITKRAFAHRFAVALTDFRRPRISWMTTARFQGLTLLFNRLLRAIMTRLEACFICMLWHNTIIAESRVYA